jgi:hypothetical protein
MASRIDSIVCGGNRMRRHPLSVFGAGLVRADVEPHDRTASRTAFAVTSTATGQNGVVAQVENPGKEVEPSPDGAGWLLLVYRVPSEPTRLRAAVWRRLKGLGAIYLQNSAATLPASPSSERALRKLRHEILEMSGTAVLLSCTALAGEQDVLAAFQTARDDEYEEIIDKCHDFMAQLDKEYKAEHFSYAELEENEEDLIKLRNWFAKVADRDVFEAPGKPATVAALQTCEEALEAYATRVYAEEGESR